MIVAIDIDEVLADFLSAYLRFCNARSRTSFTREQFRSYRFEDVLGGTREDMLALTHEFHDGGHLLSIPPLPAAQEGIARLARSHELIVVTSRPHAIERETREWIERHFPGVFSAVHLTNEFSSDGPRTTKALVCLAHGAKLIVDDNLDYAAQCAQAGVPALLLDAPWNRAAALPDGVTRVRSWDEIVAEVMRRGP